eukprot:7387755-Prymnesium_polylepis.4
MTKTSPPRPIDDVRVTVPPKAVAQGWVHWSFDSTNIEVRVTSGVTCISLELASHNGVAACIGRDAQAGGSSDDWGDDPFISARAVHVPHLAPGSAVNAARTVGHHRRGTRPLRQLHRPINGGR